jgi:transposase-like protein
LYNITSNARLGVSRIGPQGRWRIRGIPAGLRLGKRHRRTYRNNVVEADHGKLKQLIRSVRGFKTLKIVCAPIKGFEVMRALRKGERRSSTSPAMSAARYASWSAPLV